MASQLDKLKQRATERQVEDLIRQVQQLQQQVHAMAAELRTVQERIALYDRKGLDVANFQHLLGTGARQAARGNHTH